MFSEVKVGPSSLSGWIAAAGFFGYAVVHALETTPGNASTKLSAVLAAVMLAATNFGRQHQAAHKPAEAAQEAPEALQALLAEAHANADALTTSDGVDDGTRPFSTP